MTDIRRRRGRPATFDRDAALDAAAPLFWRHGYDGASIAMLTEAMGVTAPTLYSAFGSKEELYRAALDRYRQNEARANAHVWSRDFCGRQRRVSARPTADAAA